jgi:hypothetical protein
MKISRKLTRKLDRRRLIDNHQKSVEQKKKDVALFDKLVIDKNEYYDQLSTEDAVLSALEKIDLPDSK